MKNKKEQILDYLETMQTASTGNIANKIKSNSYKANDYLEELLKEKKVTRIQFGRLTFWELK